MAFSVFFILYKWRWIQVCSKATVLGAADENVAVKLCNEKPVPVKSPKWQCSSVHAGIQGPPECGPQESDAQGLKKLQAHTVCTQCQEDPALAKCKSLESSVRLQWEGRNAFLVAETLCTGVQAGLSAGIWCREWGAFSFIWKFHLHSFSYTKKTKRIALDT